MASRRAKPGQAVMIQGVMAALSLGSASIAAAVSEFRQVVSVRKRLSARARAVIWSITASMSVISPAASWAVGESPAIAYRLHCIGCHFEDGSGAKSGGIPPLPGIAGHLLKHEKGRLYLVHVPGIVNAGLPPDETAALLNYVIDVWGAKEAPAGWKRFSGEEVSDLRRVRVDDIAILRKEIATDLAKDGIDISF